MPQCSYDRAVRRSPLPWFAPILLVSCVTSWACAPIALDFTLAGDGGGFDDAAVEDGDVGFDAFEGSDGDFDASWDGEGYDGGYEDASYDGAQDYDAGDDAPWLDGASFDGGGDDGAFDGPASDDGAFDGNVEDASVFDASVD